jgi:hypothetical protein
VPSEGERNRKIKKIRKRRVGYGAALFELNSA